MNVKNKSTSEIERLLTDESYLYKQPWFYNYPFALRCELGIGDSKRVYLKNAKKRAFEIFDILFLVRFYIVFLKRNRKQSIKSGG